MSARRPTLVQVAGHAGVSIASASRALNGKSASAETIRKVRDAVNELGYVPDATARGLQRGSLRTIAFAAADVANPVYVEMMSAMEQTLRDEGYRLTITSAGSDPDGVTQLVSDLGRGYADGMIISPLRATDQVIDSLENSSVPVVVIGRARQNSSLDRIGVDSAHGIGLAVAHLHEISCRSILLLNGPADTTPGHSRENGFLRAVSEDSSLRGSVVRAEDFTTASGEAALAAHLAAGGPVPDAVIGANDLLAIGSMHALEAHGVHPGTDVAVVGMDDTNLTDLVRPALTSVSLGSGERARAAAGLLIDRIRNPHGAARAIDVTAQLVIRSSTTNYQKGQGVSA